MLNDKQVFIIVTIMFAIAVIVGVGINNSGSSHSSSHTCYVCGKQTYSSEKIGSYRYCPSCAKLMHKAGY